MNKSKTILSEEAFEPLFGSWWPKINKFSVILFVYSTYLVYIC